MKTIKSLLICGLLALTSSAFAQSFTFTFGDVNIVPGETAALNVTFKSDVVPAGWQMYLYLPTGITIAEEGEEQEPLVELSDVHHKKHTVDVTKASDGSMMLVMSGGTKTYEMSASEGDLCTITLKADATFEGSATVDVKKIAIADKGGKQYNMASDASFTITAKGTGIDSLNAADDDAPAYNLAGQKVGKNYKGVVVKSGKKVAVK
jgi:hypothetical protein